MDHNQAYCQWSAASAQCSYQQPTFTWLVIAYISVIISAISALLNIPIDALFELLSAPTADPLKVNAADTVMKRIGRKVVAGARRMSANALQMATAMKQTTLKEQRLSIAGTVTRELTPTASASKKLALASLPIIAPVAQTIYLQRKSQQLKMKQQSGRGFFHRGEDDLEDDKSDYVQSDDDDDDECDSDSEEDKGNGYSNSENGDAGTSGTGALARKGSFNEKLFQQLKEEVTNQRRLLPASQHDEYDNQWGLDPTGGRLGLFALKVTAQSCVTGRTVD